MRSALCLRPLWLAAMGTVSLAGCGPTCGEVAADHRATVAAWPAAALPVDDQRPGPHAVVSLPTATVERLLEAATHAELRRLDLAGAPGAGPLSAGLGDVTITLSAAKLVPGPTGAALAVAATLNLGDARPPGAQGPREDGRAEDGRAEDGRAEDGRAEDGRAEDELRLTLRAVLDLAPEVYAEGVQLRLDPGRVRDVALEISPATAQVLGAWLYARLPEAVQSQIAPAWVALLLPAVVEGLSGAAWSGLRALLEGTLPGPAVRWPLPPGLPRPNAVAVAVVGDRMQLAVSVPGGGLALGVPPEAWTAGQGEVAVIGISGPVLAAVAGAAINAGTVPGRFDAQGEVNAEGPVRLLPGWGAGPRPARLQTWQWPDRCLGATLSGAPGAAVRDGELHFTLSDLEAGAVWASPLTMLGAWWSSSMAGARAVRLQGAGAIAVREVPLGWDIRQARFDASGLWLSGGLHWGDSGQPSAPKPKPTAAGVRGGLMQPSEFVGKRR